MSTMTQLLYAYDDADQSPRCRLKILEAMFVWVEEEIQKESQRNLRRDRIKAARYPGMSEVVSEREA